MRVRTFKPQFAPLVKSGAKRQTIRPMPQRLPKIGDLESWREWTARPYNSPQRELAQVRLISVERLTIVREFSETLLRLLDRPFNGSKMTSDEWRSFARADGFRSLFELAAWFESEHGFPFAGIVINAEDL